MTFISSLTTAIVALCLTGYANAACGFVSIDNRAAIGQSLYRITKKLGPSGYRRLPDEDFWTFEKDKFDNIGVSAPVADLVAFGTYKHIIFQSNLRFKTSDLKSAHFDIASKLGSCAKKIKPECWKDSSGRFYEFGSDSKDTYIFINSPRHGPPNDPDLPPRNCR
ncbi:hypothetical protein [Chitinimonas taiwanensis]|uniref:hypothetical protein n=1 Tax=Chitinimonas taiwanensis TaxID=240412 RepID=UPI001114A9D3|nr:hypothetical protein [Chitinimonas taiwanensis]